MVETKPFGISKRAVWEAYRRVKENRGAAGVDHQSLEDFGENLSNNLYKLWNRLASGSYFPPPVLMVAIPKAHGGVRMLGIPTVADRIAQMVVKHTDCRWVRLYIERWLKAPFQQADGGLVERERGTPQGGVVSPVLANLFLHYAFDKWRGRNFPNNPFARYADDAVVHCRSEAQARYLKDRLERRFRECKLELHPEKTQIVCCHVGKQQNTQVAKQFDFLGYCYRTRLVRSRDGRMFVGFTPAISPRSAKKIRQQARRWRLHLRTSQSLDDIARAVNPAIRGWVNYYGAYQRSR